MRRFKAIPIVWACCCALALPGCGVPSADGPAETFGLDFSLPASASTDGAIVFLVDGVKADVFQEMLQAGELPAIKTYFADRGLYVPRAAGNVPSVTLANLTSLATGRFPGHHGITGINWFDRNRLIWRNYETIAQKNTLDGDYTAPTAYELLADRTTFSVFFQPHRGATKFIENWTSAGPPFFFGWYEFVDRLTLCRLDIVADVARKRRAWPALTVCYLLAPDFRAYDHGVDSEQYRQALRHTDRQIGRVLGDLKRHGLLEKVTIVLTSDHGMTDVRRHCPLQEVLREQVGLNIAPEHLWERQAFETRLDYYRRYSAVVYGSGDRYFALCLRRPIRRGDGSVDWQAWPVRPGPEDLRAYPTDRGYVDLLTTLTEMEAVDAVAYSAGKEKVRVRTSGGEVEFSQPAGPGGLISYRLVAGTDPLGWARTVAQELLEGQPASARTWLTATISTRYPDLPAQILAYFRSRLAGDIAIFAAPGWDLNSVNRAGHGGLGPDDMLVPLLIAGPGVPPGRLRAARTVDVVPTILRLLARPVPHGLDGQSLVP